jgi:hypothetical protein
LPLGKVTASARRSQAMMCGSVDRVDSNMTGTCPAIKSISAGPPIPNANQLNSRHILEQFACHMWHAAIAGRRHIDLARIGVGIRDELRRN